MENTFSMLWQTFGRYRWHVSALVTFGIFSALLEGIGINMIIPLMSFFTGTGGVATDFITKTIQGLFSFFSIPFKFRYLLCFVLALFILRAMSVIAFGYVRGWITADFLGRESKDILRRTLLVAWPFSLKQKLGSMHNTLVRDVQQTGTLLDAVAQVAQSFSGFLMYFLVAINISPSMTFYALGGGAVLLIFLRPLLRRAYRIGEQTAAVEKKFAHFLSEHIIGMKSIKAAGAEQAAIADGNKHIETLRTLSIRQSFIRSINVGFFQPFSIVIVVALFLLTYNSSSFNVISFAASLYLIQKIFAYLESGQAGFQSINSLGSYARNISAFKHNLDIHSESSSGAAPFVFKKELAFKGVSFAYDEGKTVLNTVDFSIHAGETIGLIGPSGAGKTSVADLLLRLFKPSAGALLLDGVPSESIALQVWRSHIGYVAQDVFLLNTSIEENIRFYRPSLSKEDIIAATKQANIYDFIMGLQEGFDTVTGDRGVMLSGGQRQRIALARALAGKPAFLILDEATSALDSESEKLIQESIRSLHGSVTVFIIAHRLSTIEHSDRLLVLDSGKIVEEGTPQELLSRPDSYFSKHHGVRRS